MHTGVPDKPENVPEKNKKRVSDKACQCYIVLANSYVAIHPVSTHSASYIPFDIANIL